jgi:outer membrane protein
MPNSASTKLVIALCFSILTFDALAFKAGDYLIRAGATTVEPRESTTAVTLNGADAFGGSELGNDNNTQLGLTLGYMFNRHWGVELLAATPFEHTVTGKGALGGSVANVAQIKHLPPTLSALYYPFFGNNDFRPYVGLGLNYTLFFDEQGTDNLEAFTGSKSNVKLDDSYGIAAQIGADFKLNENWYINTSLRWIKIETEAEIEVLSGALAGSKIESDVDINPYVYTLSIGFKY